MLELDVGVNQIDSVFFLSSNTGSFVVFVTFIMLFFIAANVGGGQVFTFMASTTICWSGRSVLIFRWSPGNIILFALIDTSRIVDFPSSFIMFLGS